MPSDTDTAAPATASGDGRKHTIKLALRLLAGLVIIAAPVLIAVPWIPGVSEVAFFGVLAASFGWISGGPRVGAAVVGSLAMLGVVSILLRDQTWALALILILLGLAYGVTASRGFGNVILQLPILTPYFMHHPPGLLNNPPIIDGTYLFGIVAIMVVTGAWTILVLHLAAGKRSPHKREVRNPRVAVIYGAVLGVISAAVMTIGTTTDLETHWVWVTLTLYVLADPQQLYAPRKMWGRVLGTFGGFAVVTLLALIGVRDLVLTVLAVLALWLCLVFMILKKPYWEYALFLTIAVILMDTSDVSTLLLDAERFGFTLLGAGLSVLAALVVNFIGYGRGVISAPESADKNPSVSQ